MVAAGALEHHQQSPAASKTAEEEASKRNTDCVYFLASPLTCKKGSECEYRHSEYARVNPRDCYYWLNGNCLNPRCPFRHPPLDGLLGTQTAVPAASSFPSLHSTTPPAKYSTNNLDKQVTPCIFFQKGLCIKGDKCVFLHGPNNAVNKTPNPAVASTANEPPTLKKSSGVARNCTQEQKFPPKNAPKAVVGRPEVNKPTQKFEIALSRNDAGSERNAPPPSGIDNDVNVPPITNGNSLSRISRLQQSHALDDQSFQHNMESDEFLRESSPGFDVLVADELRDHDYYREEGQYLRTRDHEGRDLNPVTDYDVGLSIEYNSMTDMERETFHHPRGYESYDHVHGQYDWGQHKAASDRMSVGGSHQERKSFSKAENHTRVDESDLRYRLSKQRRVNGLRSVVSPDYAPEFQRSSQREMHNLSSKESSLSSRLRGRIKLHSRSPVNGGDLRPERELDRGRNWGSVSPGRPRMSHVSRLPDRLKGRVEVDFDNRGRNLMDEGDANFSGPKSLSELKGGKNAESQERQSFRKRKSLKDPRQPEGDLSFDGPMPLCEILKRKRGAEATTVASTVISSVNNNNNNSKENEESLAGSSNSNTAQSAVSTVIKEASNSKEANIVKEIECINQPSQLPSASEVEAEDGVIGEERMEDQYLEADDQRDGEYEYEPGYEGDYNYEEGVNADGDEESYADDDGDDFAKKIGVMFS